MRLRPSFLPFHQLLFGYTTCSKRGMGRIWRFLPDFRVYCLTLKLTAVWAAGRFSSMLSLYNSDWRRWREKKRTYHKTGIEKNAYLLFWSSINRRRNSKNYCGFFQMMKLIVEHILWTSRDQKVFDLMVTVWFMFELANTQLFTHNLRHFGIQ